MIKKTNTLGPGLVIGIPTLGRPTTLAWALGFKGMNPPINFNVNFQIIFGQEIGAARCAIAKHALNVDSEYLFFLGDDVVCPGHTLRQLLFRMENRPSVGIVGGVYCSKSDPPAPLVFVENGKGSYWDWKVGEFFECSGLGMDCTLIRTQVFKDLLASDAQRPFFKTVDEDSSIDGINAAEQWTEDLYFFRRVSEETQWKTYCDASVICDHEDVWGGKTYKLPKDSYPLRQKVVTNERKLLMLGPAIPLTDASFDLTRCNDDKDADWRVSFDNLPFQADQFDWTIVSAPQSQLNGTMLKELKRVSKGKISINFTEEINRPYVAKLLGGKVDGTFVEFGEKECPV
jgi:hypothetical protein